MKFHAEHIFSVRVGVVFSLKAGAKCRSYTFFPNTFRSLFPVEKKTFLNMWLNYHTEKTNRTKRRSVCASVLKGHQRKNTERQRYRDRDRRLKISSIMMAPTVNLCVLVYF